MSKVTAFLLSVLMVFAMVACSAPAPATTPTTATEATAEETTAQEPNGATGEKIYVGVSAGLTGDTPLEGELMVKSVTLATEQINAAGGVLGGRELVPVFEDDGYTAEGTIAVANKFVSDDKICAIVGLGRSMGVVAISDIVKEAGMPTITSGTSTKFYELNNPYIFRVRSTDAQFYKANVKYLVEELGATKIGVVHETDEYGHSALGEAESKLKELGADYITLPVNSDVIDCSGQITQLRDSGCDGLLLILHPSIAAIFSRQMIELGWKPEKLVGGTPMMTAGYMELVTEEEADGIYIACDFDNKSEDPYIVQFVSDFAERWDCEKEDVDVVCALHYNLMFVLADAIERAGSTDRAAITEALKQTKDLPSTLGPMTCDERNDMVHTCNIFKNIGKVPTIVVNNYDPN